MMIKIFDLEYDGVIESRVASGKSTYEFALNSLFPLTGRFEAQRKTQDKNFYKRLERDLIDGCIMPPLTIAFVKRNSSAQSIKEVEKFINENIRSGYILDGIQRLNTLQRLKDNDRLQKDRPIYLNIIIAPTEDKLLYRMITLNNGQKPMTPRHQIEILTQELFDFTKLEIDVQSEKERESKSVQGAFKLGDISRAYLAFLTDEVNNENNKIIGDKMDQIIVGRIMDKKPESSKYDFKAILKLIEKFSIIEDSKRWLRVANNLIGFCVGAKSSYDYLLELDKEEFAEAIILFDKAFKAINPSKVNLGKYRRELSKKFIGKFDEFATMDELELIEQFAEWTS